FATFSPLAAGLLGEEPPDAFDPVIDREVSIEFEYGHAQRAHPCAMRGEAALLEASEFIAFCPGEEGAACLVHVAAGSDAVAIALRFSGAEAGHAYLSWKIYEDRGRDGRDHVHLPSHYRAAQYP